MIKINIKDPKQMTIAAVLVGVCLAGLYIKFLLLPQMRFVARSSADLKKAAAAAGALERDISETGGLKKQVAMFRDKIASRERMLPAEQEIPKLLEDLSNMAKKENVKIIGITPLKPNQELKPDQTYREIPILINAKSGYHELGKFISDIENADRFMKVVDINIKQDAAAPKKHDVQLMVFTYQLLEKR